MADSDLRRFVGAGLTTALVDGLFACVLSVTVFDSTILRLWQTVTSTILGKAAYGGGLHAALIGVVMHFGVAFFWSGVFLLLDSRSTGLRRLARSRYGLLVVAAVYGPLIWLVMSLMVVPLLVQRPPAITWRWWVQLVGHAPFVGLPIVAWIAGHARCQAVGSATTVGHDL